MRAMTDGPDAEDDCEEGAKTRNGALRIGCQAAARDLCSRSARRTAGRKTRAEVAVWLDGVGGELLDL